MDKKTAYRIIQCFIDGSVPAKYVTAVKEWLLSGKDKYEKEGALFKIWENTSSDPDDKIEESLGRFRSARKARMRILKKIHSLFRYAAVILAFIVCVAGVWLFSERYYGSSGEMKECYVPNGEMKKLLLSDGSLILVNSGSKLIYPKKFGNGERELYLDGEAYFEVKHDTGHPFVVHVKNLNVRVLGTHFNIKAYDEEKEITTTLVSGAVKVYETKNPGGTHYIILHPDEQSVYDCIDRSFTLKKIISSKVSSWTSGSLDFEQEKLQNILSELERRFNVRFTVDGMISMNKQYTMNFRPDESLEDVLSVLKEISGGIFYSKEGRTIHLYLKSKRREVVVN